MQNLDLIVLSLAIIAMLLSILQLIKSNKQMVGIKNIHESVSTRFIGQFPIYMHEIVEILKDAKREIKIVCDIPAFGAISDTNNWIEYRQLLDRKNEQGLEVDLTFLNKERREKIYYEQFIDAKINLEDWKSREKSQLLGKPPFRKFKNLNEIEKISWDEFVNCLRDYDEYVLNAYFNSFDKITELNFDITIYFWIVDGVKAVFAIPKFSIKDNEFVTSGFITQDSRLINSLLSLKESYYERIIQDKQSK